MVFRGVRWGGWRLLVYSDVLGMDRDVDVDVGEDRRAVVVLAVLVLLLLESYRYVYMRGSRGAYSQGRL